MFTRQSSSGSNIGSPGGPSYEESKQVTHLHPIHNMYPIVKLLITIPYVTNQGCEESK